MKHKIDIIPMFVYVIVVLLISNSFSLNIEAQDNHHLEDNVEQGNNSRPRQIEEGKIAWVTNNMGPIKTIRTGDLDGDGLNEIILRTQIDWYKYKIQVLNGTTGKVMNSLLLDEQVLYLKVIDLNLDGIPEIITSSGEYGITFNVNTGKEEHYRRGFIHVYSGINLKEKWNSTNIGCLSDIIIEDIDEDGTQEIMVYRGASSGDANNPDNSYAYITIYDGNSYTKEFQTKKLFENICYDVYSSVDDFDDDGDLEAAFFYQYMSIIEGKPIYSHIKGGPYGYPIQMITDNIDNDEKIELVISVSPPQSQIITIEYKNQVLSIQSSLSIASLGTNATAWTFSIGTFPGTNHNIVAWIFTEEGNNIIFANLTSLHWTSSKSFESFTFESRRRFTVMDINDDGIFDLVVFKDDHVEIINTSSKTIQIPITNIPSCPSSMFSYGCAMDIFDVDNDGVDEIIVGTSTVFIIDPITSIIQYQTTISSPKYTTRISVVDIDNDTFQEILVGTGYRDSGNTFEGSLYSFKLSQWPFLLSIIEPIFIIEDIDNQTTINLNDFFIDYEDDNLNFDVEYLNNSDRFYSIELKENGDVLITPLIENWTGIGFAKFKATDSNGHSLFSNEVEIVTNPINDPPIFLNLENYEFEEDTFFEAFIKVYDGDNDNITLSDNSPFFNINQNGSIIFIPTQEEVGNHLITISADDNNGSITNVTIWFNITNVNDPPIIILIEDQTAIEDSPFELSVDAFDEDGDNLTYDIIPDFIKISEQGVISFIPRQENIGKHLITIMVTDANFAETKSSFNLSVENINDNPEFINLPTQLNLTQDVPFSFQIQTYDEDGDKISFEVNFNWFSIDREGYLKATPTKTHVGTRQLKITISDSNGGINTTTILIIVNPINNAPTVDIKSPKDGMTYYSNEEIKLDATSTDLDEDTLEYSWDIDGKQISKSKSTIIKLSPGIHNIKVTVSDGELSTNDSITIIIEKRSIPSTFSNLNFLIPLILVIILIIIIIGIIIIYHKRKTKKMIDKNICPECGTSIDEGLRICPSCESELIWEVDSEE